VVTTAVIVAVATTVGTVAAAITAAVIGVADVVGAGVSASVSAAVASASALVAVAWAFPSASVGPVATRAAVTVITDILLMLPRFTPHRHTLHRCIGQFTPRHLTRRRFTPNPFTPLLLTSPLVL